MTGASQSSSRFAWIDGLRALSALWVIIYDVWSFNRMPEIGFLTPLFQSGHLGVEVFMVLSGFCLFYPLSKETFVNAETWKRFFVRRARRILPPYYVAILYALLLPFAVVPLFKAWGVSVAPAPLPSAWDLGAHLTLSHNFFPELRAGINPSFWSLSLEAQFYLIFPLLAVAILRLKWWGVLLVLSATMAYRGAVVHFMAPGDAGLLSCLSAIPGRMAIFFCGMLAAWIVRRGGIPRLPRWLEHAGGLVIPGFISLGFWFYFHPFGSWPLSDALIGVAIAFALVRFDNESGGLAKWVALPALVSLGEISYSFYLINRPTCYYVTYLVRSLGHADDAVLMWLSLIPGVTISMILASYFYRWFEQPFLFRSKAIAHEQPVLA